MKLKLLAKDYFEVVAVMDGNECPADEFLRNDEESTRAARIGLIKMIDEVSRKGLHGVPHAWTHVVNEKDKIYEFRKDPFRLFFFKGENGQIAVCTTVVRKSGQKVDKPSVKKAAKWRNDYFDALENGELTTVK